jgi:hypothetical protein
MLHVRISAGGAGSTSVPTATVGCSEARSTVQADWMCRSSTRLLC